MDVVAASGTGFAFRSMTTYFARDIGLDAIKRDATEAEVSIWRSEGACVFRVRRRGIPVDGGNLGLGTAARILGRPWLGLRSYGLSHVEEWSPSEGV